MPQTSLESLFMQAPALICIVRGPDHAFDLVNESWQGLFAGRDLPGTSIREALPELEGRPFLAVLDDVFRTGKASAVNEERLFPEERYFNFVLQPMVVDGRVEGVMVMGFDVTDQVRAKREKDEFIAVVAHELRTPMTSILGWVRMLHFGDLDAATHAAALDALERSTKAQARIIEDLLDESRIASGKLRLELRTLNLARTVEAAVEMMRPAAEAKEIALLEQIPGETLEVTGDPNRLQQIVANVLSNAIKFSPEGGRVEVRVSGAGGSAEIEVRDRGRGISRDLLPHVFERFRQGGAGEQQGGLGLGLAIARHLVELQDGTITADSEGEGKGAVFTIRLPLRAAATPDPFVERDRGRVSALPSLKGVHILIVEDNIDNREVIAAVMTRCAATVECTSTVKDALLRIGKRRPDAIIADVVLPDVDGCAFIQGLRAQGDDTPALALTVFGRPDEQQRILAAGFDVLRQKPIEPADLANEIARLVQPVSR